MTLGVLLAVLAQCPEVCGLASYDVSGCINGNPTSDQTIAGYKQFTQYADFRGSISVAPGINAALSAGAGVTTICVAAPLADQSLRLYGRKRGSDQQSGVIATAENFVDGGIIFSVNPGGECSAAPIFNVSDYEVGFGATVTSTCGSPSDKYAGALVDQSGVSDHVSLTCVPRYFVTIAGRLGENRLNTGLDGGCNASLSDGGCYMEFSALHGELTVAASVARNHGGWLQEWANPVSDGTNPKRAFVDVWGGYGQRHMMIREQFPKCPADLVVTTPQLQFYFNGALESTMLYAFDEHRWYFCNGTEWEAM